MTEPRRPVSRPVSKPVVTVARNKEAELTQLERRYRSTFKKVSENDECTIVRLAFPPSDPDFPFELNMLQLQLRVPARYPKESCTIIVMNANIPKGFAFNLEKGFENYTKQTSATLVRQMNWLDKNIENLLQQEPATTMRFVSTTPKSPLPPPKPEEKQESLIAPALPEDFIAAATTKAANIVASSSSSSTSSSAIATSSSSSKPIVNTQQQQKSNKTSTSSLSLSTHHHHHHRKLDAEAVPFFTSTQLSEAAEKREKELKQLQARFRGSYKTLRNDQTETVVQLVLNLEDPEFSYKDTFNKELKVKYHIPVQYPLLSCTIEVENKALGVDEARDISYVFAEHVEKSKRTLFQNLNWLNRNLEMILQYPPERPWEIKNSDEETSSSSSEDEEAQIYKERASVTKQQQDPGKGKLSFHKNAKASLFDEDKGRVIVVDDPSFLRPTHLDPSTSSNSMTNKDDPITVSSSSDPDHSDQTKKENEAIGSSESSSPSVPRNGTAIYIYDYQLENITLFRCIQLNMVVKCSKCKTMTDIENLVPKDPFNFYLTCTKENSQVWKTCTKCRNLMGVKFFSDLMHQSSNKLGLLQLNGCLPFDILTSKYIGACVQCMDDDSAWTLTPHDHPKHSRCFECHTSHVVTLGDFRFIRTGVDDGDQFEADQSKISKAMLKRKKKKEAPLTVGEPLPDKGTCDHYRKSKRWFRFPCCSRLYPCDVCHDKQEDHIFEMARRHVCGQCSREQAIAPECTCGHVFERSHSRFWEGGEGTRSKALMSRKDPHKYKGLGKTSSKKQERVGTAGKNKRKNE
ncbi:hypothetical protein INT45_001926 [Circinella minor]|uniref:CHY-type domain-containing protein n=1 Tax=Circinella minor TaxID=1195481 RepID=A0A8H7VLY6_9FUNG|nr:hypothetical protein INT45_001926 [Circinella minor]